MVDKKTRIGTVDLTPTWLAVLPILIETIKADTPRANDARAELERMATLADLYVARTLKEREGGK